MRLNTTARQVLADIEANRKPSDAIALGALRKKGYVVYRPDGTHEITYLGREALEKFRTGEKK